MSGPVELQLHFAARADELADVRRRIRESLSRAAVEETVVEEVLLAVGEACQNIIRHGYAGDPGPIVLSLRHDPDAIELTLTDDGPTVDPSALQGRDLDDVRPGGLGLHLIHRCMDEVAYEDPQRGQGNILRMVKRLR